MPDTAPIPRRNWFARLADDLLGMGFLWIILCMGFIRFMLFLIDAVSKLLPSLAWLWTALEVVFLVCVSLMCAVMVYGMYRRAVAGLRYYEGVRKIDKRIW